MAENKKSFVLYADLIKSLEHLTNEEKGILFNHLLEYVNDMNPNLTDRLILTAWKPIELQLKRDLVKFEEVKAKRSEAGKRSAELRALRSDEKELTNPTSVESVEQRLANPTDNDNVNDNDNDNVNDNDNDIKKKPKENKFNFKKSLIDYGFKESLVEDWLVVRKAKKASDTETSFNSFISTVEKNKCDINSLLEYIINRSWSGFNWKWVENNGDMNLFTSKPKENIPPNMYRGEDGRLRMKTPF
jgi:hypothetical protein